MKNNLKKVVEPCGSIHFLDKDRLIQGEAQTYLGGTLFSIENYKDSCLHGKREIFLSGGGSEIEYYFYGTSVSKEEFEHLERHDIIKERFNITQYAT